MRRTIDRAARKLRRSATLLDGRRLNWRVETNDRIRWEFEAFVRTTREVGFPLELHVQQYDTPNEAVIQIAARSIPTGTVNREEANLLLGGTPTDTLVVETGGTLVASQSASGHVHFIMSPRTSDRIKPKRTELILLRAYDPTDVTTGVIRKALKQYLLLLQDSTILGSDDSLTFSEKALVLWISFRDLRNRYELYSSLLSLRNEWGKALVAGAIAFLVGYFAAGKT